MYGIRSGAFGREFRLSEDSVAATSLGLPLPGMMGTAGGGGGGTGACAGGFGKVDSGVHPSEVGVPLREFSRVRS